MEKKTLPKVLVVSTNVYDPELAQRRFQANLRRRGKPQQAGT